MMEREKTDKIQIILYFEKIKIIFHDSKCTHCFLELLSLI